MAYKYDHTVLSPDYTLYSMRNISSVHNVVVYNVATILKVQQRMENAFHNIAHSYHIKGKGKKTERQIYIRVLHQGVVT